MRVRPSPPPTRRRLLPEYRAMGMGGVQKECPPLGQEAPRGRGLLSSNPGGCVPPRLGHRKPHTPDGVQDVAGAGFKLTHHTRRAVHLPKHTMTRAPPEADPGPASTPAHTHIHTLVYTHLHAHTYVHAHAVPPTPESNQAVLG